MLNPVEYLNPERRNNFTRFFAPQETSCSHQKKTVKRIIFNLTSIGYSVFMSLFFWNIRFIDKKSKDNYTICIQNNG